MSGSWKRLCMVLARTIRQVEKLEKPAKQIKGAGADLAETGHAFRNSHVVMLSLHSHLAATAIDMHALQLSLDRAGAFTDGIHDKSQEAARQVRVARNMVIPTLDLPAVTAGAAVLHYQGIVLLGVKHKPGASGISPDFLDLALLASASAVPRVQHATYLGGLHTGVLGNKPCPDTGIDDAQGWLPGGAPGGGLE